VADEQQPAIGRQASQLGEGSAGVKATGQRRVRRQPPALLHAPLLGSQLNRLPCAHLGAEQDGVEVKPEPFERDPGRARLAFAAHSQAALGIRASAMRLRLGVT